MLDSGSSAMLSSLTWCPLCASRTTHPPVQISLSICCLSSWWRPTLFPGSEVGDYSKPWAACTSAHPCFLVYVLATLTNIFFVYLPGNRQMLTKMLSPFDDSVDKNPVVRSVVLKLLLKYRWGAIVAHCIHKAFLHRRLTLFLVFLTFV